MLQLIRGKVGSWFVKLLFGFLILSFAVWGIGDIIRQRAADLTVATVGDLEISAQALDTAFAAQVTQMRRVFGQDFDTATALRLGLLNQALNGLITNTLYDHAAADFGLTPSDDLVKDVIRRQSEFQNEFGQYDRAVFESLLAINRLTVEEYFAERQRGMAREQLAGAVGAGATIPATLADRLYRFTAETRRARLITIDDTAMRDIPAPTEPDLIAYHQDNAADFTDPEYRVLTIVSLTPELLAEEIGIPEQVVRDEYDANIDRYTQDEQRGFDQVVVADEDTAAQIAEAAQSGLSLRDAVGDTGARVVSLDLTTRDAYPAELPELAEAAFTLPVGGVSDPVRSPFGWHVLQIAEIVPAGTQSYETVRPAIEADLKMDEALDLVFEVANELDDALAGGATLEEAADRLGLPVTVTPPLSRSGLTQDGGEAPAMPARIEILRTAFQLADREESRLEETVDEGYYIARLDRIVAPSVRPLDAVRAAVADGWYAGQRAAAALALAETVAVRLGGGEDAAAVAADIGATATTLTDLRRDGSNRSDLPRTLINGVFALDVGGVAVSAADAGQYVAVLEAIQPATSPDPGEVEAISERETEVIANELLSGFLEALRAKYGVEIHAEEIDRFFQPN